MIRYGSSLLEAWSLATHVICRRLAFVQFRAVSQRPARHYPHKAQRPLKNNVPGKPFGSPGAFFVLALNRPQDIFHRDPARSRTGPVQSSPMTRLGDSIDSVLLHFLEVGIDNVVVLLRRRLRARA